MPFMPFQILGIWLRGLLAIAILAGAAYLLKAGYDETRTGRPVGVVERTDRETVDRADAGRPAVVERRVEYPAIPGWNRATAMLVGGLLLLTWGLAGRPVGRGVYRLMLREDRPGEEPRAERTGQVHKVHRADGSVLHVECYGPEEAQPLVLSHGWGANSTEWFYAKQELAKRFRLIVWDEPGLGLSSQPANRDFSLDNFAEDLKAVVSFAGARPAILVGHSIGGMAALTFCKRFPEALGTTVSGLVLVHTTYTNPVRTTKGAAFYTAIEKPVIIPLLYLTIGLWPLVWAMNWLSYLNGSMHRSTHKQSFGGTETRGQLDFMSRLGAEGRPDVLARGMLGMIGYDATGVLPSINVPTLVVNGDQDTTTLPEAGERIAREVRRGELAVLSPAKHLGLIEHHATFDARVAEFVEAHARDAVSA